MKIKDDGRLNPLIIISRDEVADWLRQKADEAGYGDRRVSGVQINVTHKFAADATFHHEVPELVVMASNIKDSR